jgi:anhydro-N-acetylmuramic acid kinase
MARTFTACGIMSGTSRDGIDIALVRIDGKFPKNRVELVHPESFDYPSRVRDLLMTPPEKLTAEQVVGLDFRLGKIFGESAARAIENAGLAPDKVEAIGSHGQTLLHFPQGRDLAGETVSSTLQVGSGAVIAQTTGITTVSDFRSSDIAVGGEGAPLVPVFDYVVLRSSKHSRIALNIGGIANLTAIPKKADIDDLVAFDTGPGNCMIDTAVRLKTGGETRFDKDGALARLGDIDDVCVREVTSHPYFSRKPPKTTGWEEFGEAYTQKIVDSMSGRGKSVKDMIRTLTEVTSKTIVDAIENFVRPEMEIDEVIVTGGGSHNSMLMGSLRRRLPDTVIDVGEAYGLSSDFKEACAFAYLAYLCLNDIPANVVSQAAGLDPAILGAIYPGARHA